MICATRIRTLCWIPFVSRPASRLLFALLLISLGVGAARPSSAQPSSDLPSTTPLDTATTARVDSIFAGFDQRNSPGCALGVVHDGRLAYTNGYGVANLDYERPITPRTVFYLASVSKQFTAATVLIAEQNGYLSLDDPVRKWLPDLPRYSGGEIRLSDLIHHTSGLRDYDSLAELAAWDERGAHETDAYLRLIYRQKSLDFPPGTKYKYSNTNYLLLGEVVQAATGSTLREFARKHLFSPLGMDHTHFHDDRTDVVRNRAIGYASTQRGFKMVHPWNYEEVGAGGLYASIEDLARWDRNFITGSVGSEQFARRMSTRGRLANGDTTDYAFGLSLGTYRGQRTVGHRGGYTGFRTQYLRLPDTGWSVIVLCNSTAPAPRSHAYAVADIVLGSQLASRQDEAPARTDASELARDTDESITAVTDRLTGRYEVRGGGGMVLTFKQRQQALVVQRPGRTEVDLVPASGSTFKAKQIDAQVVFHVGATGPADSVTVRRPGLQFVADRVGDLLDWKPSDADRAAYTGHYYSDELAVTYQILETDQALRLVQGDRASKQLQPKRKDEYSFGARGRQIRFIREETGQVTGLEVTTSQVDGIRFERKP